MQLINGSDFFLSGREQDDDGDGRSVFHARVGYRMFVFRRRPTSDSGRASLDPVVEAGLLDGVVITIEGHVDISEGDPDASNEEAYRRADPTFSRADPEFLMSSSQRRAIAVANYLVGQGVPASSIRATGFGATRPVVPGSSPRNRRVEVRVARNGGSGK